MSASSSALDSWKAQGGAGRGLAPLAAEAKESADEQGLAPSRGWPVVRGVTPVWQACPIAG